MGVFSRVFGIFRAGVHDSLDRMEDPEKMLNQYVRNMEIELENAQGAIVKQLTAERIAEKRLREAQDKVTYYEEAAGKALQAGHESLARQSLAEKVVWAEKADVYLDQLTSCQEGGRDLKAAFAQMQADYSSLKHRRDMLVAKAQSAKAQKRMVKAMDSLNLNGAAAGFRRMEEKIDRWQAETDAIRSFNPSSMDDELRKISDNSRVEAELEQLKAKLTTAS